MLDAGGSDRLDAVVAGAHSPNNDLLITGWGTAYTWDAAGTAAQTALKTKFDAINANTLITNTGLTA